MASQNGSSGVSLVYQNNDRFGELLERRAVATPDKTTKPIRLNVGAGDTEIEGYLAIDRKNGLEAYPLDWPENSVDEIRASHVLEHFPHGQVPAVLADWARVLRPGGRMRIAVPDWEWLRKDTRDPKLLGYVYGGQTDDNDYHKCGFNDTALKKAMEAVGVGSVRRWQSDYPDCSAHPCSLNLEGYKGWLPPDKTVMLSSVPRLGFQLVAACKYEALTQFKIPCLEYQGAYFHQCLENSMEDAIRDGFEWCITHDYDTTFSVDNLVRLFRSFEANPFMDALAPLQVMRNQKQALMGLNRTRLVRTTEDRPFEMDTAHFGLTVIRLAALKGMPKPWFTAKPNLDGAWRDFRVDADIYFWNQWKEHGRKLFVDPGCRVGHLEEYVSTYNDKMEIETVTLPEWRAKNGYKKTDI